MAIGISIFTIIILLGIVFMLTVGKPVKRKWTIWGLAIMFGIGPVLAWLIGICVGIYVGGGFAAAAIMVMLVVLFFVIGLISLTIGIFKKDRAFDM